MMRALIQRVYRPVVILLLIVALSTTIFATGSDASTPESNSTVDFVLLIDFSTSMPEADPDLLSATACSMFLDMLPLEHARIAVLGLGTTSVGTEYSLQGRKYEKAGDKRYVRLLLPMTDVAEIGEDDARALKDTIAKTLKDANTMERLKNDKASPIGAATVAAVDLLEDCGATDGNACIILLSDGDNTAEHSDYTVDRKMQRDAAAWAGEHNWPAYALQLFYGGKSEKPNPQQMKKTAENSAAGSDGWFVLDDFSTGSKQLANAFLQLFNRFMGKAGEPKTENTDESGKRIIEFDINELTSEATIVAAGSGVRGIRLKKPNTDTAFELSVGNHEADGYIMHSEEGRYVCAKLICPEPGTWTAEFFGDKNAEFIFYQCSMQDVDLELSCLSDFTKEQSKDSSIDLTVKYVYHGGNVHTTEDLLRDKRPSLYARALDGTPRELNDIELVPMNGKYSASITMKDLLDKFGETDGSFFLYAIVKDDMFRDKAKKSNEIGPLKTKDQDIIIKKDALPLSDQAGFIYLPVEKKQKIDLEMYVENPDGDIIDYELNCITDRSIHFPKYVDDENYLYITDCLGEVGEFELQLTAKDPNYPEKTVGTFILTVNEREFSVDEIPEITLWIEPMFWQKPGPTEATIKLSDYYSDPDGLEPIFSDPILNGSEEKIIDVKYDKNTSNLLIQACVSGNDSIRFTVSDQYTSKEIVVPVQVRSMTKEWWKNNLIWVVLAGILFLALVLTVVVICIRTKVKGIWDFDLNDGSATAQDVNINTLIVRGKKVGNRRQIAFKDLILVIADLMTGNSDDINALQRFHDANTPESKLMMSGVLGKRGFVLRGIPKSKVTVTLNGQDRTGKVKVLGGNLCIKIKDSANPLTITIRPA